LRQAVFADGGYEASVFAVFGGSAGAESGFCADVVPVDAGVSDAGDAVLFVDVSQAGVTTHRHGR
jgi:hypothetical protein